MEFTHFDENGKAVMVDVTDKTDTVRTAKACGKIVLGEKIYKAVEEGNIKKGDVLGVAAAAGIMGAKKTWEIIPMCHILPLGNCHIEFEKLPREYALRCICTVKVKGKTGVEMEALTGVSTALLTVYDMCKSVGKNMQMGEIYLMEKTGGKSGEYHNER